MEPIHHLLRTCALIEGKVAELYRFFGDHFHEDRELAMLWVKTAGEEDNHSYQFRLAGRTETGDLGATVAKSVADRVLESVTTLLDRLRKNPPAAVQALQLAIQVEERLAGFHMDTAVVFKNNSTENLYRAMMACDRDHVKMLKECLEGRLRR